MAQYRGSEDYEKLSIANVLNNSVTPNKYVLYAKKIDKNSISTTISTYKTNLNSFVDNGTGIIGNIIETLKSTQNSKRFYTGEVAQERIADLNLTKDNLLELKEKNNLIDEEEIQNVIDQYNEKLVELKKGARMTLLKATADDYNNGKHVRESATSQQRFDVLGEGQELYHDKGFLIQKMERISDVDEYNNATYQYTYYDYINYWAWFTGEHFPFNILDDNLETLEAKIIDKTGSLPYEVDKIVDYE